MKIQNFQNLENDKSESQISFYRNNQVKKRSHKRFRGQNFHLKKKKVRKFAEKMSIFGTLKIVGRPILGVKISVFDQNVMVSNFLLIHFRNTKQKENMMEIGIEIVFPFTIGAYLVGILVNPTPLIFEAPI